MKIVIGSDKSGFSLKEAIKQYLDSAGTEYTEIGTTDPQVGVPFFEVAPVAAKMLQSGEADRAILICGTGMGMSQVANSYRGVRAACVEGVYSATMCRAINDSNALCMGGWMIAPEMGLKMVEAFLNTEFQQGLEDWRKDFLAGAKQKFAALEEEIYNS